MSNKVKQGLPQTKEGLPKEAFAIVGDPLDPETWKLPHHTRAAGHLASHYRKADKPVPETLTTLAARRTVP